MKGRGFLSTLPFNVGWGKSGERRLGIRNPCQVDAFVEEVLSSWVTMVLRCSTLFIHPFMYFAYRCGLSSARRM